MGVSSVLSLVSNVGGGVVCLFSLNIILLNLFIQNSSECEDLPFDFK